MPSDPLSKTDRDFFAVATKLSMLSGDEAVRLTEEAARRHLSASQLVLQKGLLDVVQIDIVDTLQRPADVVPGYEILDLIGKGAMGVVYRARQKNLDRIVALKTVLVSQMADPSAVSRFEQEAITVGRLRHPNIITAYDFGRHEGRLYLAMELVEGEDFEQWIKANPRPAEVAVWGLARQVAAGLAHAAQANIVHRDIKPANLLLVEPPAGFQLIDGLPMVKIADFGLAFLTTEIETRTRLTAVNTTIGSPNYMAPEQFGNETIDFRADVYALGATVYHILAGRPPFGESTLPQLLAKKLSGEPPQLQEDRPEVSRESADLVRAMMSRKPDERPSDYRRLIERIDGLLASTNPAVSLYPTEQFRATSIADEDVAVETPSNSVQAAIPKSRRRRLIAGLVIAATVIAAAAILSPPLLRDGGSSPGLRDMVLSGWGEPLFDGKSLAGWIPSSGAWIPQRDEDGGNVLSGTNGMARRLLLRRENGQPKPLHHYRVTYYVRLHEATAVELRFGIVADPDHNGPRWVFRMTPDGIQLGRRPDDRGEFEPVGDLLPVVKGPEHLHVVQLERQREDWWVFFDEQPAGSLKILAERQLPEIQLAAEKGPAWFSDLSLEELEGPARADD